MEYITLNDEAKLQITFKRIQELEAQHYDRSLSLHVLLSSDQTPEVAEAINKLRAELATIESTVGKLRETLSEKEEVTEDSSED